MKTPNTNTPLTDAAKFWSDIGGWVVSLNEARELERKLNEANETIARVWKALGIETYEQAKPFSIYEHVEKLRARIVELEKDKQRLDWLETQKWFDKGNCDIRSEDLYKVAVRAGSDYYTNNPTLPFRLAIDQAMLKKE